MVERFKRIKNGDEMNIKVISDQTTFHEASELLWNDPSVDGIEFTENLEAQMVPFVLLRKKNFLTQNVYSVYFRIPRVYDEIYTAEFLFHDMCVRPYKTYWVVQNRIVAPPSKTNPLKILNKYFTFVRLDFHSSRPDPLYTLKTITVKMYARVYQVEVQRQIRQELEQDETNESCRWYFDDPLDLSAGTWFLYALDTIDLRFFETDFHGFENITGKPSLNVVVATRPKKFLLHKLIFGEYPFEILHLVDEVRYPSPIRFTLIRNH